MQPIYNALLRKNPKNVLDIGYENGVILPLLDIFNVFSGSYDILPHRKKEFLDKSQAKQCVNHILPESGESHSIPLSAHQPEAHSKPPSFMMARLLVGA